MCNVLILVKVSLEIQQVLLDRPVSWECGAVTVCMHLYNKSHKVFDKIISAVKNSCMC